MPTACGSQVVVARKLSRTIYVPPEGGGLEITVKPHGGALIAGPGHSTGTTVGPRYSSSLLSESDVDDDDDDEGDEGDEEDDVDDVDDVDPVSPDSSSL